MRGEHLRLLERYAYLQHALLSPGCNFCEDACPEQVQIAEVLRTRMYDVDRRSRSRSRTTPSSVPERAPADLRPRGVPGRLPSGIPIPEFTRDAATRLG